MPLMVQLAGGGDYAASPFKARQTVESKPEASSWQEKIVLEINRRQLDIRKEITGFVGQIKKEKKVAAILALIAFSFLYGLFHALGPGHGKNIIMSYMLSEENPSVTKGVLIGSMVAFGEALSASLIVYGIYYLSLGRIRPMFDASSGTIQQISYLILACIGFGLLLFRTKKHLPRLRPSSSTETLKGSTGNSKGGFLIVASLAIIPCPGVMILLVFMLAMKLPLLGLLLVLAMAVGMSITISAFGVVVAVAKPRLLKSMAKNSRRLEITEAFLEIGGAVLIIVIAALFLLS